MYYIHIVHRATLLCVRDPNSEKSFAILGGACVEHMGQWGSKALFRLTHTIIQTSACLACLCISAMLNIAVAHSASFKKPFGYATLAPLHLFVTRMIQLNESMSIQVIIANLCCLVVLPECTYVSGFIVAIAVVAHQVSMLMSLWHVAQHGSSCQSYFCYIAGQR